MTKEDKELLMKDLSARLPYCPKVKIIYQQQGVKGLEEGNIGLHFIEKIFSDMKNNTIIDIKVYLRPMSSMTEEERQYILNYGSIMFDADDNIIGIQTNGFENQYKINDWLNKKMFDYRGLIDKCLALEAREGMYKDGEK